MLNEFIEYLNEQVKNHSIYVWGAQGQNYKTITKAWIKKRETSEANAGRAIANWEKQCKAGYTKKLRAFDCSGLAMYFLYDLHKLYKSDMTANGLKGQTKAIKRKDLKRGDWVFRVNEKKAYHVGYVVDDELNVVEAKGRDDGVIKRHIDADPDYWNVYGRPKIFEGQIIEEPVYYTVKKGDNLTKIAKAYKTTVAEIVKLNGIKNPNIIRVGQKLRIK